MSRTYRRKNYTPKWCYKDDNYYLTHKGWQKKKLFAKYHADGTKMIMNTPGWWWNNTFHRPNRRITRDLITKIKKLLDYEEAPIFPHHRRPKEYYW